MRWFISFLLIANMANAAYVVTSSGRQINGERITAAEDGSVTLFTAGGQSMTFQQHQYRSAKADRPRELDLAKTLFAEGKDKHAMAMLNTLKVEYRFLAWDQPAIEMLADYYFEQKRFAEAAAEYQRLEQPSEQARSRLRAAVMKSSDPAAVLNMLNHEIASGSRAEAAKAYLARGDLKLQEGDAAGARRDWLKVVQFFKAEKDTAAEAEARLKEE